MSWSGSGSHRCRRAAPRHSAWRAPPVGSWRYRRELRSGGGRRPPPDWPSESFAPLSRSWGENVNAIAVLAGSSELDGVTQSLDRPVPQCAADLQLLGKYEGSGFREDHFLAIRGDGQVVHLSPLLYWVLSELQPGRTPREVAEIVSARLDRQLTAEGVEFLVANKLVPSGLVLDPEPYPAAASPMKRATGPAATRANPLLALRLHRVLLPERATRRAANLLKVMFAPVIIMAALLSLIATDVTLLATGAGTESLTVVLHEPILMLAVLGLLLSGTLFHELGHAAGCRYGGGNPGVIGVGVYVIVPAFYTNVTDAYRLDRAGRLRTDLGGVYFNGIAAWAFGIGYLATGWTPLLLAAFLMHLEALQQLLPLIRSDGYFILADAVGVPDLFGRIRPVLASLLPWRAAGPRVKELRPRVRVVISVWVLVVVPVLGVALFFLVVQTPTMVTTTLASVTEQWVGMVSGVQSGSWAAVALGGVSIGLLMIPLIGLAVFLGQLLLRLYRLLAHVVMVLKAALPQRGSGRHRTIGERRAAGERRPTRRSAAVDPSPQPARQPRTQPTNAS